MEITYTCEVCGNEFQSGRVRKGKKVCGTCAADLRKKGQGFGQLAKAGQTPVPVVAKVEATATVEATKVEAPVAPDVKGTSLSQLAAQLREKHAKGGAPIGEPIEDVES